MEWIRISYLAIEYLAVTIIVGMAGYSTIRFLFYIITKRKTREANFREYRLTLGAGLLLGLEILVAADVIRTVALEPTLENIASLGLLVVVRIFLGWALVVEIEGRWPWQPKHGGADSGGPST